jgi:type I restriction enzyme S subunit
MKWKETIFDNVLRLNRGFDLPNQTIEEGPYPVVASTSIKAYHKDFKVEGPGVVTGRSGSLGTVQYLPGRFWPLNTSLYVKDFKGNNERFIAYFLQTMRLENFNSGAGVPTLNQNHLHKLSVKIPPLPTQRKIAAILTAYDDLIETNKRRIALLEKMAEELYREWFVRMRFPGHQNTRFVKGVPEGWEMRKIEKAFDFTGGGTPSKIVSSYWNNGTVNWFTPSDITGASGIFLSESEDRCSDEGLARSSAKLFPPYSVMMTSRATIGAIGINTTPACTNQGFITCIPNERYPLPYLYQWLKLAKPHFDVLSGGATFPELTKGTFKKLEIMTPSEEVIEKFTKLSTPIFMSIESLLKQNEILTKTRDLLLPRLISGKLSIENLDIQFPPGMQEETPEPESAYAELHL